LKGIHVIDGETAVKYSVTGPVLRAAGVPYDIRRADPYSVYDRFEFDVAMRPNGDLYDNYLIRLDEIWQSLRILQQATKQIPAGPINSQKPQYQVRVPAGEAYGRTESPKGELAFYIVSNGKPNPWRYHVQHYSARTDLRRQKDCRFCGALWCPRCCDGRIGSLRGGKYVRKRYSQRIKRYLEAILGYIY
jgi:NADH:ubiquinone oxidoreductase subunit D